MKIQLPARVLAIVIAALTLAGCTSDEDRSDVMNKPGGTFYSIERNPADLIAPVRGESGSAAETAAEGANEFAFRLSSALAKDLGDDNLICSPYSVWLPLAALVSSTNDANKAELLAALGAAGISEQEINEAASRMLYDLMEQGELEYLKELGDEEMLNYYHNPLKIVNAIFVDNDVTLKKGFAQSFADYYRGSAINVDFASPSAVEAVNDWADKATDGLIDSIVSEFDPQTVAAIANAIYFSDRWDWEFSKNQTEKGAFHSPVGDLDAYFMLREGDMLRYYEDENVQAMPLYFRSGGGMYIILPKDGDATGLLRGMTADYFDEITRNSINATGKLLLPRFKLESGPLDLADMLSALGVPLFDASAAPLTGGLLEEDIPVWLSGAVHKAVIEVDEQGTTAAAVTVMMAEGAGIPEPTAPFEMVCDSPFVFVLYRHTYDGGNQVLFTGVVNQP